MKINLYAIGIFIFITCSFKSNGQGSFEKTFQYSPNSISASIFQNTNDGGVVLIGGNNSINITDRIRFLSKFSSSYIPQWSLFYNPTFPQSFLLKDVIQMIDNDYLVTGTIEDSLNPVNNEMFLMRTDSIGNIQYIKTYHDPTNPNTGTDNPFRILKISDSTYFIFSQAWAVGAIGVFKVSISGQIISMKYVLGNYWSRSVTPTQAIQLQNGNYLISANYYEWYQTATRQALLLACIDSSMNIIWQKTIQSQHALYSKDAFVDASGNIVLINSYDSTSFFLPFISKLSAAGDLLWNKTFSNASFYGNMYNGCEINGSYVFNGVDTNPYLITTDTSGNITGKKYYSGSQNIFSIQNLLLRNNSLLMLINENTSGMNILSPGLILTDSFLQTQCSINSIPFIQGSIEISDTSQSYSETANYIDADISSTFSTTNFNLILNNICFTSDLFSIDDSETDLKISVNRNTLNIIISKEFTEQKIKIYNILGKEMIFCQTNTNNISLDVSSLSQGVYLISLMTPGKNITKKIVLN